MEHAIAPFLKLVDSARFDGSASATPQLQDRADLQLTLFPETKLNLVISFDLEAIQFDYFKSIIKSIRPKIVIDLRIVPRFNYSGSTRKDTFQLFRTFGIMYYDVSGALDVSQVYDARMNPAFVGMHLQSKIPNFRKDFPSIAIIVEKDRDTPEYMSALVEQISPSTQNWNWLRASPH